MPAVEEEGFTLIEVLTALVAVSLMVAILVDGAVGARTRQKMASIRTDATLLASELLTLRKVSAFQPGTEEGARNGLTWRLTENAQTQDPRGIHVLSHIDVRVFQKEREIIALSALRLKSVPPE